jgi:hypothetical protein
LAKNTGPDGELVCDGLSTILIGNPKVTPANLAYYCAFELASFHAAFLASI